MSAAAGEPVNIRILEKDYLIACPEEEREDLQRAASLLEGRLKKARESARGMGSERWLIMAALNMANELAKITVREERSTREMGTRVRQMRERVERALVQGQQLEL
jgi:cell division protein ZapA